MSELFSVKVNENSARKLMAGYPWVFRSEVINAGKAGAVAAGSIVDFTREKGDWIGRGFYNPASQLVGRVMTREQQNGIDAGFLETQLRAALAYREKLYVAPFYRLVHAESDGFPGLIIDRYGDVLVVQVNTAGMEALYPQVQKILLKLMKPKAIVLRNDSAAREQEGLPQEKRFAFGGVEGAQTVIVENGVQFAVDLMEGQKTGWFFDQRDNRAWVAELARGGSIADIFSHTGGFGVTALAKGATSALFVDSSEKALNGARRNVELNGAKEAQYIEQEAFAAMEKLAADKRTFNVVSVDPPAFIKSRKDMNAGMKGYQKLTKLAVPLVAKGGYLFFASCSHHASPEELLDSVTEMLAKSRRNVQLIRTSGAAPDHPVLPLLPETGYLKSFTFRFLD